MTRLTTYTQQQKRNKNKIEQQFCVAFKCDTRYISKQKKKLKKKTTNEKKGKKDETNKNERWNHAWKSKKKLIHKKNELWIKVFSC